MNYPNSYPTSKQINFLCALVSELRGPGEVDKAEQWARKSTRKAVSIQIEKLKGEKGVVASFRPAPLEEGFYALEGAIFRVRRAHYGDSKLYAQVLNSDTGSWSRANLGLLRAEHKLTLEAAEAFGKLYGRCCLCGRLLTEASSMARGIGPRCAKKL